MKHLKHFENKNSKFVVVNYHDEWSNDFSLVYKDNELIHSSAWSHIDTKTLDIFDVDYIEIKLTKKQVADMCDLSDDEGEHNYIWEVIDTYDAIDRFPKNYDELAAKLEADKFNLL